MKLARILAPLVLLWRCHASANSALTEQLEQVFDTIEGSVERLNELLAQDDAEDVDVEEFTNYILQTIEHIMAEAQPIPAMLHELLSKHSNAVQEAVAYRDRVLQMLRFYSEHRHLIDWTENVEYFDAQLEQLQLGLLQLELPD